MTTKEQSNRVMIELIKVGKSYPPDIEALTEVSLSITRGEMLFLTGKSGAGKTTLLRLLCRIEQPDKGLVEIDGMNLSKISGKQLPLLRRKIGVAYQDFKLLQERTVARNIAMAMEVCYQKKSFINKQTRTLLELLGLSTKSDAKTADLSRGEQQRVAIARALANNPEIILADEPTGNLDAETTGKVMRLFNEQRVRGATLLIATHDTSIYADSGHRVIELKNGRIATNTNSIANKQGVAA